MSDQLIQDPGAAPDEPGRQPEKAPLRIFLNYRREDSSGHAGRLYDDLAERFQESDVFIDIDKIEPGLDFAEAIDRALDDCDVVLALIGRQWLTITDGGGKRRIDNPDDYVRLELEAALERGTRLIPVRVQGAEMPSSVELPEPLRALARRNAIELSDTRWRYDVDNLAAVLDRLSMGRAERERLARDAEEQERRADQERLAAEAAAKEQLALGAAERERLAAEAAERELIERERLAAEVAAAERLVAEAAERERIEHEKAERERARREREAQERAEKQRLAEGRKEQARLERERRKAAAGEAGAWWRKRKVLAAAAVVLLGLVTVGAWVALSGGDDPSITVPAVVKAPAISGGPRVGQTLTAGRGTWTGTPTAYAFQWRRCDALGGSCRAITGADRSEYRVTEGDVGRRLRVSVRATNAGGSLRKDSVPTRVVGAPPKPPVNTGVPVVSGSTQEGRTLTATTGKWSSSSSASFAFVWKRCSAGVGGCSRITGATKRTYAVGPSDVGRTIRVEVTASNRVGKTTAASKPTAAIAAKPEPQVTTEPQDPVETQPADPGPDPCDPLSSNYDPLNPNC